MVLGQTVAKSSVKGVQNSTMGPGVRNLVENDRKQAMSVGVWKQVQAVVSSLKQSHVPEWVAGSAVVSVVA